jgi:hypothetical protein
MKGAAMKSATFLMVVSLLGLPSSTSTKTSWAGAAGPAPTVAVTVDLIEFIGDPESAET